MKTVIYHSADYDGIFCREIAKKFLGTEGVEYVGWNFGDQKIKLELSPDRTLFTTQGGKMIGRTTQLYVLDLSPECLDFSGSLEKGMTFPADWIVWIDHHKTSIEKYSATLPGYRIDGVAACRLAWQWFAGNHHGDGECYGLPTKEDFVNRNTTRVGVPEPLAVRLAGEYDIWDHRGDGDLELQFGLRCEQELNWAMILNQYSERYSLDLIEKGKVAMAYSQSVDASICKSLTWIMKWEGLNFLCVNHGRFNSLLFASKDVPETGHDALLGFRFDGKNWLVSLYHATHRKDLDLSEIAKKHGGGGHRGACGFTCDKLPFNLLPVA